MENSIDYTLLEHRHRFSAWAAARAAQRSLTSVENLCRALVDAGMPTNLSSETFLKIESVDSYSNWHANHCEKIQQSLHDQFIPNVKFGRAAKLLAVYLKSMVIISSKEIPERLKEVIFPPIDRILLKNMTLDKDVQKGEKYEDFIETAQKGWTNFSKHDHKLIINYIENLGYGKPDKPFWTLESYWQTY